MKEPLIEVSGDDPPLLPIVVVSKARWYVCIMYAYMAFMQGLMWFTFSSVPESTEVYYKMSAREVDVLLSWGSVVIIVFLPLSAWIASLQHAIKYAIVLGAASQLVGGAVRTIPCFLPEAQRQQMWCGHLLLHIGQVVIAVSGPLVFSTPSRVAFEWFPDSEKNIAASIIMNATTMAQAVGYIIGPLLAPTAERVPLLLYVELGLTVPLTLCAFIRFPALPRYSPSAATFAQHAELAKIRRLLTAKKAASNNALVVSLKEFWAQMRVCMRNPHFVGVVLVSGLYVALLIVWDGLLPQVLAVRFSAEAGGWMGFGAMIAGIVFCQAFGVVSDKLFKHRIAGLFCAAMAATLVLLALVAASFPGVFWRKGPLFNAPTPAVATIVVLLGGVFTAPYGLVYILAAEMSYPASESISAVLVSWLDAIVSMVFLYVWPLCDTQYFTLFTFAGCLLCAVAMGLMKTSYPRSEIDEQEKSKHTGAGSKASFQCIEPEVVIESSEDEA